MAGALLHWTLEVLGGLGLPGIALVMGLETAGFPVPSEPLLMLVGMLAASGQVSLPGAVLAAAAGGVAGAAAAYAAGRWGGRPLLYRAARVLGLSAARLQRAEAWFRDRGDWAVFFGRMLPGVRTLISLPAGAAAMPFGRFASLTFLGSLPWCFALIYAGYALGGRWHLVKPYLRWLDLGAAAVLVAAAALWWLRRRRRAA